MTDGTLEINLSSGSHGPYAVSTGATLRFTGSHTFADAANEIISGAGTVEFSAGTANINSTYGPVGSTLVSGASATFAKLAASTGPFSVSSGTLKFSGNHDSPAPKHHGHRHGDRGILVRDDRDRQHL